MTVLDFVLYPVYVYLFILFFKLKKESKDPLLGKYLKWAFTAKIIAVFAFTIFNVYISRGDSYGVYYAEGANLYTHITRDISLLKLLITPCVNIDESIIYDINNLAIYKVESNFMVVRIAAFFSFFTLGRYMLVNFLFGMVAFSGLWRLFKFFYSQFPHLHKQLALSILFFPTVIFWSSGAMKDTICMAAIGFITYSLYEILYNKRELLINGVLVLLFSFLLITLKMYIFLAYLPFFILFLILKNVSLVKNRILRYLIGPVMLAGGIFGIIEVIDSYKTELGLLAVENITETVKMQQTNFQSQEDLAGSNFSLGVEFDGSAIGLAKLAPAAVAATLFRPFLWESKKISTILSSLEGLALMYFTLLVFYKAGFLTFFKTLFKDPTAFYCFGFAILFAVFVGATTLNFGSLVRYKIPGLPFYAISLFIILDVAKNKSIK